MTNRVYIDYAHPIRPVPRVSGWSQVTAAALVVMSVAAAISLLVPRPPLTNWVLGIFVLCVPGAAILRITRLPDRLLLALASVALSFAIFGLVTVAQAYFRLWSPSGAVAIVIGITAMALLFDPAFASIREHVARVVRRDRPVAVVGREAHPRPVAIGERVGARSVSGMSIADGGPVVRAPAQPVPTAVTAPFRLISLPPRTVVPALKVAPAPPAAWRPPGWAVPVRQVPVAPAPLPVEEATPIATPKKRRVAVPAKPATPSPATSASRASRRSSTARPISSVKPGSKTPSPKSPSPKTSGSKTSRTAGPAAKKPAAAAKKPAAAAKKPAAAAKKPAGGASVHHN